MAILHRRLAYDVIGILLVLLVLEVPASSGIPTTRTHQQTQFRQLTTATMPSSFSLSKAAVARPAHHANDSGSGFRNPWPSADKPTWTELLQISNPFSLYNTHNLHKHDRAREVKVVDPDWGTSSLKERGLEEGTCMVGTWLGHAGAMAELPLDGVKRKSGSSRERKSLWLLFDPIFSTRAGPTQYTGPSRMKPSPCQVTDLPACDAVVISHNHYDHLDLLSLKAIVKRFPACKYFVPLGNKSWLCSSGVPQGLIYECDWWGDCELSAEDFGFGVEPGIKEETKVRFTCVPAQHNSGRGTLDQNGTLWCGWVIEQLLALTGPDANPSSAERERKGAIYHAGDTGFRRTAQSEIVCPIFEEIGKKFGPFDLSFVPIWRGGSLGFVSYVGLRLSHNDIPSALHASPADAIDIHRTVKSRNTVGVHFGTFIGSENESYEAVIEFDEAREKHGVQRLDEPPDQEHGRAGILDIGGSLVIEIE